MVLTTLDYIIIASFFLTTIIIGVVVSKRSGKDTAEYFLSGRNMPWWLLGFSMVATTFSTDTPNLVTDIVRQDGVAGNWVWWAFLLTGLLTVFVYAKLWRKSNVTTDLEFYTLRYSGKPAKFLRGFRSIYLGVVFNIIAMAAVNLAAIKIGQIMLGLSPIQTVLIGGVVTAVFSSLGGFRGVIYTDFVLFFVAIVGAVGASYYLINLPEVGGLSNLVSHPNVSDKLSFFPDFSNTEALIGILIIPLAVQWWSSWYPGAEPGGGGYIAQRMLAAKNENHAIGATFFFNIMHYALRPWPWILVALASLVMYPDIASIQEAFPNVESSKLGHDLAYSAMLTKLPAGLLGLVLASLGAAFMSTLSTHLNWGSSYIVNDFYKQQIKKDASEKELVNVGRITTIVLMVTSAVFALYLTNAKQLFDIILMFGAGTGLVYILRWFWWRINAWSEISVMFSAMLIPLILTFTPLGDSLFGYTNDAGEIISGVFPSWFRFIAMVIITSIVWIVATYLTKPESKETLRSFYKSIQPGGPGWKKIVDEANAEGIKIVESNEKWSVPSGILAMLLGCVLVYSCLFSVGNLLYGEYIMAGIIGVLALVSGFLLARVWKSIGKNLMS
ncbi:Na+/proline symporter [Aquimarina sp. EL_43]|uniref:sodium:solute symporter family protein n=1 Tax=unclassified Aquimarina TaxID=2627091 RepID=UPI0018CABE38|nr:MULTISPECIES: sodium:solute symporter family protein [unclassified Aquimarina]MBG6129043.1 Na+/proline symporter [Aquimarina sp. EL_35]MBG6150107.1 Na+/proline symporter [Aquimarina sp. EL_32]MBG6167207.1 Na+/proline symporter [Aquimarina sp. EL_43]